MNTAIELATLKKALITPCVHLKLQAVYWSIDREICVTVLEACMRILTRSRIHSQEVLRVGLGGNCRQREPNQMLYNGLSELHSFGKR